MRISDQLHGNLPTTKLLLEYNTESRLFAL